MAYLSLKVFSRTVAVRRAQHKARDFCCLDQFFIARLCATEGTRIVAQYRDQFANTTQTFLPYGVALQDDLSQHVGQRKPRQSLGSFADLTHHLIKTARTLYADETAGTYFSLIDACEPLNGEPDAMGFQEDDMIAVVRACSDGT